MALVSAVAAIAAIGHLIWYLRLHQSLAEDAAMLVRYARHLGEGAGFRWNLGETPVDGATDWLSTLLLGGIYALGVSLEAGPRLLGAAAHVATVALAVALLARPGRAPFAVIAVAAALLIAGPAKAYLTMGFLTPLFALPCLAAWGCVLVAAHDDRGSRLAWICAAALLIAALTRPEGLGFAVLTLAAAACVLPAAVWRRFVLASLLVVGVGMTLFAVWRLWYFGRLLPLPFLKKGGGVLHLDGLRESLRGAGYLLWWALPVPVIGVWRGNRRWTTALLLVVGGFLAMWVLLSPEMNQLWRFQYAVVPITVATSWFIVRDALPAGGLREVFSGRCRLAIVPVAVAVALVIGYTHHRLRVTGTFDGPRAMGLLLADFGGPDRTLVTTEAGALPLYSEWRSVDAWGLNDPRVVADGLITTAYLRERNPDVIFFHANYAPGQRRDKAQDDWGRMVDVLRAYAACRDYQLAAAFVPEPSQGMYAYVRRNARDGATLTERLRTLRYVWPGSRQVSEERSRDEIPPSCDDEI